MFEIMEMAKATTFEGHIAFETTDKSAENEARDKVVSSLATDLIEPLHLSTLGSKVKELAFHRSEGHSPFDIHEPHAG